MNPELESQLTSVFLPICGEADGDVYPQGIQDIQKYLQTKLVPYFEERDRNEQQMMLLTLENALSDTSMSWERLAASHLFPFEFPAEPQPLVRWLIQELKSAATPRSQ
jgi:hypothetical protein